MSTAVPEGEEANFSALFETLIFLLYEEAVAHKQNLDFLLVRQTLSGAV